MPDDPSPQFGLTLRPYTWLVIIAGLLVLIASCVVYVVKPNWILKAQVGVGFGLVLLLLAILLQPNTVHTILLGRSVKYGSNAVVMSLAFVGILVFINFLSLKSNYEYDLTETGKFTLSEPTIKFLENLTEPVQVFGFFRTGDNRWELAEDYMERYSHYTDQLTYAFYDPNLEPILAESYELKSYGLVIVSGIYRYETPKVDEQAITTSMMYVISHSHNSEGKKPRFIPAKMPTNRQLFLTPFQMGFVLLVTVVVMPLAVLMAGVRVWWIRR